MNPLLLLLPHTEGEKNETLWNTHPQSEAWRGLFAGHTHTHTRRLSVCAPTSTHPHSALRQTKLMILITITCWEHKHTLRVLINYCSAHIHTRPCAQKHTRAIKPNQFPPPMLFFMARSELCVRGAGSRMPRSERKYLSPARETTPTHTHTHVRMQRFDDHFFS